MYGTLRGALAGRKIAFDRDSFTAAVDGRISVIGKTIRIKSIHVHYDVACRPRRARRPSVRCRFILQGCPAASEREGRDRHHSGTAALRLGDQTITLRGGTDEAAQ
jgi:hypothetical protein